MELFTSLSWTTTPFITICIGLLGTAVLVQLYYIMVIFGQLLKKTKTTATSSDVGVSVIVCAHNELDNLKELLPLLNAQDYPNFEVIVMNDRSKDGTNYFLTHDCWNLTKVRSIDIEKDHDHVTPKKYALTTGIRQAKNDIVLLTDADCRPTSDQWIGQMVANMNHQQQIVLGFSPYQKYPGFLNFLIRIETFYVAVQYLSFALSGKPYMGVGRNLMYHRELFLKNKGFFTHLRIMGGDDDLLMNEIATAKNTAICIEPSAMMVSEPKLDWKSWFTQKKRHLLVSKKYKSINKFRLGLLTGSHLLVWISLIASLIGIWCQPNMQVGFLYIIGGIFGLRLIAQWIVLGIANQKLKATISSWAIPVIDLILFVYYLVMGVALWFKRKEKVRWR
jgi:glycosyltransferase involved in cell wall biosynthesis